MSRRDALVGLKYVPPGGCTCGKRPYESRADAKQAARQAVGRGADPKLDRARFAAYRCPSSKAWHVGHASARNRQLRREAAS